MSGTDSPLSDSVHVEVAGRCPMCGSASLFLGSGGWVTCSWVRCPDPTAVADLLDPEHGRQVLTQYPRRVAGEASVHTEAFP